MSDEFFEESDKDLPDHDLEDLWPSQDKNPEMKIIDVPEGLSISEAIKHAKDEDDEN